MTCRTTTRLLVLFRRLVKYPLVSMTAAFVLLAMALSFVFYIFERGNGSPYNDYFDTLRGILVLIISGFDVEPPRSSMALFCSYLLMVAGIAYIAFVTAMMTNIFVQSSLRKGITMGKVTFENHIIVCGWVDRCRDVLDQLFSPDLKEHSPVVIIDPNIEEAPMDHPLLRVIRGDPTKKAVLEQANAARARAAIILADRECGDANAADARNLLISLAVETLQPEIYSCVEVLNPENAVHFQRANVDEIISISEISNHLVVQAALNPGVSRLVSDMLTFGEGEELYQAPAPAAFFGRSFTELSSVLMHERGLVLVGVSSNGDIVKSHRSKWRFREGDTIFVLSEDEPRGLENVRPEQQKDADGSPCTF